MSRSICLLNIFILLFAACTSAPTPQEQSTNNIATAPLTSNPSGTHIDKKSPEISDLTRTIQHAINRSLFLFDLIKFPPLKKYSKQTNQAQTQWVEHFPTFGKEDILSTDTFLSVFCEHATWKSSGSTYAVDFGNTGCQSGDSFLHGSIQISFEKPIPDLLTSKSINIAIVFKNFSISTPTKSESTTVNGSIAAVVVGTGSKREIRISSLNFETTSGNKSEKLSASLTGNLIFSSDWSTYGYYQLIYSGQIKFLSDNEERIIEFKNIQINQKQCKLNPISGQGSLQTGGVSASFVFSPGCDGGLYVDTNGVPKYEYFDQN